MNIASHNSNRIFSFFAGAGFLDLGFEHNGFEVCFVNEWHKPFVTGYIHSRKKLNIPTPRHGYSTKSIEELQDCESFNNAYKHERRSPGKIGFIGGPPCPDFSIGGKNRGQDGENGKLSRSYIDLILAKKPDFFLFENVKGLYRTKKHREFFDKLKTDLSDDYLLHERLINSIEYGAPQDRERIILLGFLKEKSSTDAFEWTSRKYPDRSAFSFPWPTTEEFCSLKSIAAPIGVPRDLTVEGWFRKNSVEDHPNANHCFTPRAGLFKFQTIDEGDDSKKSSKRLHRWRYSPTAAYGNNEVHLHPYKARRISVAEALAIQSLPREFELPNTMTLSDMFKTVGNGVPYLAALGLAQSIRSFLRTKHDDYSKQSGKITETTAA